MRALICGICWFSFIAVPALAGGAGNRVEFEIGGSFYAPSHNIYCNYLDAGGEPGSAYHDKNSEIHCIRLKPTPVLVMLTGRGVVTIKNNPSGSDMELSYAEKEQVLAYGQSSTYGIHICASAETGMTCKVYGKGFTLSKSGVVRIK